MTYDALAEIPEVGQYWEWSRPDPTVLPKGESDSTLIFRSVGIALTTWEIVEYSMSLVFSAFMEANPIAAERVFGMLEGIRAKQAVLEEAAQASFMRHRAEQRERDAWKRLCSHYGKAASKRNDIAHGQSSPVQSSIGNLGFFLMPRHNTKKAAPVWATPEQARRIGYLYTSADIGQWIDKFNQLDTWALVFENEYREKHPR